MSIKQSPVLYNILVVIAPTRSKHLSPLYRTPFCLVLQMYVVTQASAVDKTDDRDFQPRRSPRKHSSDRGCDNRAAARASSSSSFGACFDRSAFEHPPPEVDIEFMPPASKPKVGSDAEDLVKIWDGLVERALSHSTRATAKRAGGATSAAGGAAISAAGGAATSAAGGAATSAADRAATSAAGRAAASASSGAATSAAGGAASPGHTSIAIFFGWMVILLVGTIRQRFPQENAGGS